MDIASKKIPAELSKAVRQGRFSVLVVFPRDSFLQWLQDFFAESGSNKSVESVYFKEEDSVWLIPHIGSFSSGLTFEDYLTQLKPRLLKYEVGTLTNGEGSLPEPVTAADFDKFFDLVVRDYATDIASALK